MGAQAVPKVSNGGGAGKKFKGAARRTVTLGRLRDSTDASASEPVSPQRSEEQPVVNARTDSTSETRRSSDVGVHRHVYSFTRKRFEEIAGSGEPRQRTLASTAGTILEGTKRVMQSLRFSQLVMSQAHERKFITTLEGGTQHLLATLDWSRFGYLLQDLLGEVRAQPVGLPELEGRIQETCHLLELQQEARREITDAIKELRSLRMSHHNWRKLQDAHGCITRFRAAMKTAQAGTKDLAHSVLRLQRHADGADEGTPGASSSAAASSSGAPQPEPDGASAPEPAAAAAATGAAGRVPAGLWPALGAALVAAGFHEEAFRDACTEELASYGISAEEIAQDLEVFKRRALAESMNNAVDELTRPEAEEVDQEEFQEIALEALADDPPHEDSDEELQPQPPEPPEASRAGSFSDFEDMQPQPPEPPEASSAGSSVGDVEAPEVLEASSAGSSLSDVESTCGKAEEELEVPEALEVSSAGSSFGDVESTCGKAEEGLEGGWPQLPKTPETRPPLPRATGSTLCSLGAGSLACGTPEDEWPQLPKTPELRLLPLQSASSAGGTLGAGESPCGTLEEQPGMEEDHPRLCMRPGTPWALPPCASPAPPPSEPSRPSSRTAFRTAWGPDGQAALAKAPVLAPLTPLPKPSPLRPQVFQRRWSQLRVEQQRGRGRSAAWLQEARPVTAAPLTPEAAGARRQRLLLLVPNEHVTPFSARMRSRVRAQYESEACEPGAQPLLPGVPGAAGLRGAAGGC